MRCHISTTLVLIAAPAVLAADPQFIKIEEKGGVMFAPLTQTRYEIVNRTVTIVVNGRPETRTIPETVPVTVRVNIALDAAAGDYFDPAGNRIDPKKLPDVLKKGAVLAVARDGKPVDPEVLKKNKDVVAVLVPKGTEAPKAAAPGPTDKPTAADVQVKDGVVRVNRTVLKYRSVKKTEKRVVDGREVQQEYTEVVPEWATEPFRLDDAAANFFTPEGKALTAKEATKLLKDKDRVAVTSDGRMPTVEQLKGLGAVVLVVAFKAPPPEPPLPVALAKEAPAEKKANPDDKPYVTDAWLKDGAFMMTRRVTVFQQETREEARTVAGGRTVKVQVPVMVPVIREATVTMDPKAIEVQTPDGKAVDPKDWPKVFKEKTKVIASPTGKAVPEDVVKGNKEAKLIVLIKAVK
jgi:hypothetical protein